MGDTSITLSEDTRDDLRRYKAQDGITYDEAISKLLKDVGYIDDE